MQNNKYSKYKKNYKTKIKLTTSESTSKEIITGNCYNKTRNYNC